MAMRSKATAAPADHATRAGIQIDENRQSTWRVLRAWYYGMLSPALRGRSMATDRLPEHMDDIHALKGIVRAAGDAESARLDAAIAMNRTARRMAGTVEA